MFPVLASYTKIGLLFIHKFRSVELPVTAILNCILYIVFSCFDHIFIVHFRPTTNNNKNITVTCTVIIKFHCAILANRTIQFNTHKIQANTSTKRTH